jgi:hypothetical protein
MKEQLSWLNNLAGRWRIKLPRQSDAQAQPFKERRKRSRHAPSAPNTLRKLKNLQFRDQLEEALRQRGYLPIPLAQRDNEAPLLALQEGRRLLVHWQYWRHPQVTVDAVSEALTEMRIQRANAAIVVSTGQFSAEAIDAATQRKVILIDGNDLPRLLRGADGVNPQPVEAAAAVAG